MASASLIRARSFRLHPVALAVVLTSGSSAVLAQQAAAPSTLPEVNVTATQEGFKVDESASTKITAPLLDTPRSITVIPQEVIQSTGSVTLTDVLRTTPGITMGAGEGGNPVGDRPFLRGFDSGADMTVDGVRDAGFQSREVFNLEQVEVMKGPSSSFGGRGAAGGTINLVSKLPKAENFIAGGLTLGTDNTRRVTVDFNRMLSETTAFRLNAMTHEADVAGRDAIEVSRYGFAPSITFGFNTPTRVTASFYHLKTDDIPDSGVPYAITSAAATDPAQVGPATNMSRSAYYGLVNRDFRKTESNLGTLNFEHDLADGAQIRNVTRYGTSTNDYIWTNPDDSRRNVPNGFVNRSAKSRYSETTTAVNVTEFSRKFEAAGLKHSLLAGLEFTHEKTAVDNYTLTGNTVFSTTAPNVPCSTTGAATGYQCTSLFSPNPYDPWPGTVARTGRPTYSKTTTRSAYVFDTIEFNPQWQANFGVRYDHFSTASFNTPVAPTAVTYLGNQAEFFNYQAGLVFKPTPASSLYTSYSTSATPPGAATGDGTGDVSNLAAGNQALAPVESRNLEFGGKWEILDRKLALSAAVFRSEVTNARVDIASGVQANVGNKKVDGIELGVTGNLTSRWQVFAGYTHLDSELTDNGPLAAGVANNGKQFPNTPTDSFTLWSTYAVTPDFSVGGGAFSMSRVYGNTANTRYVPGYTRFDATASYRVNKHVDLRLNVLNLTDKLYYDKAYSTHYVSVAPGRSALITINMKY